MFVNFFGWKNPQSHLHPAAAERLGQSAAADKTSWMNGLNLGGITAGIGSMYLTGFLVKF